MRVLITSTRMPFTLSIVRKLDEAGNEVFAADTFAHASANHSKHVAERFVVPSPRYDTLRWVQEIVRILEERRIDIYVPTFEEVFYVAHHADELGRHARLLATPFETLAALHDKARFVPLAEEAGLPVPHTQVVTTRGALREAVAGREHYIARAAYSRGGVSLLSDTGPRAGVLTVDDCDPSEENPWLVQDFVEGEDMCSYSIAVNGRIAAHCSYAIPLQMGDAAGMQFLSIDEPRALDAASRLAERTSFTGNLSFDYKRTDDGLVLIECNPRATDGALLMPGDMLAGAMTAAEAPTEPAVVPAGRRAQLDVPVVLDLLTQHNFRRDVKALFSVKDPYYDVHDAAPGLYTFLQYHHDWQVAKERKLDFLLAMFDDVAWDGEAVV